MGLMSSKLKFLLTPLFSGVETCNDQVEPVCHLSFEHSLSESKKRQQKGQDIKSQENTPEVYFGIQTHKATSYDMCVLTWQLRKNGLNSFLALVKLNYQN